MATCGDLNSHAALSFCLALVACTFTAISIVQFKWSRDLRARYEESQLLLQQLQFDCFRNSFQEVLAAMVADQRLGRSGLAEHSLTKRQTASGDPLSSLMTQFMNAQGNILLAHCQNNSKLCIPGPKGEIGQKGATGLKGDIGATGPVGVNGARGSPGVKGQQGLKGDPGIKGTRGIAGQKGDKGIQGVKGDKGSPGVKGDPGLIGTKGAMGLKGDKGDIGPAGIDGRNGTAGSKGNAGPQGLIGAKGEPGSKGLRGPPGQQQQDCMCIKKPNITNITSKTTYPLGSLVNLTCDATGSPPPLITWTKLDNSTCAPVTSQGGQYVISALSPSQLGTYECTAQNPYGTVKQQITLTTSDTKPLDCNFEQGACSWANETTDEQNWLAHSGKTPTSATGPSADHTLGTANGTYLYMETSRGNPNEKADMTSLELPPSNTSCLSFWYSMYGATIGILNVYIKNCDSSLRRIFHLAGNQGSSWHEAQLQLPAVTEPHRLMIEAVRGSGPVGDIAIDDIQYYPGKCRVTLNLQGPPEETITARVGSTVTLNCGASGTPPINYTWTKLEGCGFYNNVTSDQLHLNPVALGDTGTYFCVSSNGMTTVNKTIHLIVNGTRAPEKCDFDMNNLCNWKQDTNDEFDWTLTSGETQSRDTGPASDHTQGTSSGVYAYIEASSPRQQNDKAALRSPSLPANHSTCFSMWYNMYGTDIDTLVVYAEDSCTHKRRQLWSKSNDQGQDWHSMSVDIPASSVARDFNIVVEASVGSSYHDDIAIDDLLISPNICAGLLADCNFDVDTCSWTQSNNDNFNWDRGVGQTQSTNTGPDGDHTTNGGSGHYMFIEASSPRVSGDKADLVSPTIPKGQDYCFSFFYNMLGDSMGSILVMLKEDGSNLPPKVVFNETGQHGTAWQKGQFHIPTQSADFKIVIEGVRGVDFTSDAAVDDVSLTSGSC